MKMDRYWLGGGVVLGLALAYHLAWLAVIPPGLDRDAAANGWLALGWLRYGLMPFWMPHASAPEPLIVWLQTATTFVMGPSVAALRSASALCLALAALVVYWLTLEVARPFALAQRWWAALLAGIVFACNPVVTQLARTGLRATTLPLLSALFYLLLLRAWRSNTRRDYVIAGLVLGVAAYTYLAARFLPIVIVVFVLWAWWMEKRRGKADESVKGKNSARLLGLALMGVAALIVALPQLIFFANYPTAFLERAQSVSLFTNPLYDEVGLPRLLIEKVVGLLLMFGVEWWGQYNQAARPLLLPLPFIGLLLSLSLIWRWRRQPAMLLTVAAWLIMLLPDLFGGDRMRPHELRVIGAFVPIVVLSGIGLAHGLAWIKPFVRGEAAWNLAGALLALLVAGWGIYDWFGEAAPTLASSDYEWFARPDVAFAEAINVNDAPMLVPLNDYSRSAVAYLTAQRIRHLRSGIDANEQTVQPSSVRVLLLWPADPTRTRVESVSYRFDPNSLVLIEGDLAYLMPPAATDVAQLQSECAAQPVLTATGEAAGTLCEVDFAAFGFPAKMPAPMWQVGDLFGEMNDEELRLRSINADNAELVAGETLGITSYWRAERQTHDRWRYFVHVLDDRQAVVGGDDLIPGYGVYGARLWQTDEIVPIRQVVQLPATLAPGRYWIEVGLYDPLDYERAVVDGTAATRALVGPLKVPLRASVELRDAIPLAAQFGDEITLDGYRLEQSDEELRVTLRLAALRPPTYDYTLFLHLEDSSGEIVAQTDAQPHDGQYPTAIWDTDEVVVAEWRVSLPPTLEAGNYRVWLGFYEWQSGARLPISATPAPVEADRMLLSEIDLP